MRKILELFVVFISLFILSCNNIKKCEIVEMRCEYQKSPIGLSECKPRFSWAYIGNDNEFSQKSFVISVATSIDSLKLGKVDVWNSKRYFGEDFKAVYCGKPLKSYTKYYWQVKVVGHNDKEIVSPIDSFEIAKLENEQWHGKWITDSLSMDVEAAPLFRKEFKIFKEVKEARLYVASAGYYEFFLNGIRVGNNYLDPGYTHFDKRLLYVTHDITELLSEGKNAMAVVLGNGFYNCQSRAVWDFEKARWRNRPSFVCELRIVYMDGTSDFFVTDESWKTNIGPYVYNNIYSGEIYDARLEEKGWNMPNFNDFSWNNVKIIDTPTELIVAQAMPPIGIEEEIVPTLLSSDGNTYIFDMGKNISGFVRLRVKGKKGNMLTVKYGELLNSEGKIDQGNINIYYHPLKDYEQFQTDKLILGSDSEYIFEPQFTYHGFRYVEIECSEPINISEENVTGVFVHTLLDKVGEFKCSNDILNKIWEATMLSYKSNMHSIPTDCPQREKNGWTADAHVAVDLGLLNFDGITFYEKWMNDFIDNQLENGNISGIIPSSGWGYGEWPGPVWDASLFIIPNALYDYYGDRRCIERLYPAMLLYLDFLETKETEEGILNYGLGDWLSYKSQTPNSYTSTLYYYYDCKLMARFAKLLGKDSIKYEKKSLEIRKLINDKFFNPETGVYANGTQTAQAMALYMNIVPCDKKKLVAYKLDSIINDNNCFLDYGLLGSKSVLSVLTDNGYVDTAYKMATKTEAPSWGYWIKQGYTTLCETWLLSPKYNDASLNHVFMGSICEWMTKKLAGLNYSKDNSFRKMVVNPYYPNGLDWVECKYKSVYGNIEVKWKRLKNGFINLHVLVPVGCEAVIYADKKYEVRGGCYNYKFKL